MTLYWLTALGFILNFLLNLSPLFSPPFSEASETSAVPIAEVSVIPSPRAETYSVIRTPGAPFPMIIPRSAPSLSPSPSPAADPPPIATLIKPALWKRMLDDKEIILNASLKPLDDGDWQKYSIYAAMFVGASLGQARQILTDYPLYAKMIPYIEKADYTAATHTLKIEGGIWNFKLRSEIRFEEVTPRWIHFVIINGHFSGMTGDFYFESLGEKGTVVYLGSSQSGTVWPPRFVIERGAEIVFGFTAGRMRSYIESQKKIEKGAGNGPEGSQIPKPRSHF
jgi:hypothetical protein